MQVDWWAIEAEPPAEEREHEGRAHDPPSVEIHAPSPAANVPCSNRQSYGTRRTVASITPRGLNNLAKIARASALSSFRPNWGQSSGPGRIRGYSDGCTERRCQLPFPGRDRRDHARRILRSADRGQHDRGDRLS